MTHARGLGIANVLAAYNAGWPRVRRLARRAWRLPHYAPGATGNIVMEDTAFLFASMGCDTGIDLDRLVEVRRCDRLAQGAARGRALRRDRQSRAAAQFPSRGASG